MEGVFRQRKSGRAGHRLWARAVPGERVDVPPANQLSGDRARLQGGPARRPPPLEAVAAQRPRAWEETPALRCRSCIPRESVAAVHVYFPDPWWKRKHKRRRLFTDEFVDLAAATLESGGLLHAWTDVEEYFGVIRALMDHHAAFEALAAPAEQAPAHDLDYQTSFERAGGGNSARRSTAACGENTEKSRLASRRPNEAIPVSPPCLRRVKWIESPVPCSVPLPAYTRRL